MAIFFLFQIHGLQKILQTFHVSKEDEGKLFTAIQVSSIYHECSRTFQNQVTCTQRTNSTGVPGWFREN